MITILEETRSVRFVSGEPVCSLSRVSSFREWFICYTGQLHAQWSCMLNVWAETIVLHSGWKSMLIYYTIRRQRCKS